MPARFWSDDLSDEQRAVARHTSSHARLLAGPGTGKTHTLARKVVYLVTEQSVQPSEILVLTFTRMATRDSRTKISEQLRSHSDEMPHISTLHAFALRQLRRNANLVTTLPKPFRIADDWEEEHIIREDLKATLGCSAADVSQNFKKLSADWESLAADDAEWQPNAPFVGAWDQHRNIFGYILRSELVYQLKQALAQNLAFTLERVMEI